MSLEEPIILLQIIFIDIVMAADNAIIIGLIAANYSPDNRKKIIAFGVAAAFIFRIIFALSATYLLTIAWMKILGGLLLIWVINNLRQDLFNKKIIRSPRLKSKENIWNGCLSSSSCRYYLKLGQRAWCSRCR